MDGKRENRVTVKTTSGETVEFYVGLCTCCNKKRLLRRIAKGVAYCFICFTSKI